MLIHIIVKSSVFRTFFHTGMLMLLIFFVSYLTKEKDKNLLILSCVLIISVSPTIFREVYLWSSGFANYIPGIVSMFLSYMITIRQGARNKLGWGVLLFVISFSGQLFVEHTAIINIMSAIVILVFYTMEKKNRTMPIIWLTGAILGVIVLFMIPKLFYVPNEWENYQRFNLDSIRDLAGSVFVNAINIGDVYLQNVCALVILSVILLLVSPKKTFIVKFILFFTPAYGFITNFILGNVWNGMFYCFFDLLVLLSYVTVVFLLIYKNSNLCRKRKILICLGMCIFSVLPLLIVYPTGARCLFHSYVFLILLILHLLNGNWKVISIKKYNALKTVMIGMSSIFMIGLCVHFNEIHKIDEERLDYIREMLEQGEENISVPEIPSQYVKQNSEWSYGQVFFYKEKQDINFEFIDYNDWKELMSR